MAYTPATADRIKALLPKFASVPDATIDVWLERARRDVDESWLEDDREHAESLLTAHLMTLEGIGAGAEAELAAAGLSGMQTVRTGKLSFTKAPGNTDAAAGTIESTSYGQRFLELLRKNRGGPRAGLTGVIPDDQLFNGQRYFGSST